MKKLAIFILALVLSNSAFALDNAVENIQALCGLAKQGKYSQIQGKAQIQADGSVKLASLGGKGEISFSKGDWDGLQQILWAHQIGSAKDYYACVKDSLPYFKSKVITTKPTVTTPKKARVKTTSIPTKSESAKVSPPTTIKQGTVGNDSAAKIEGINLNNKNVEQNTVGDNSPATISGGKE